MRPPTLRSDSSTACLWLPFFLFFYISTPHTSLELQNSACLAPRYEPDPAPYYFRTFFLRADSKWLCSDSRTAMVYKGTHEYTVHLINISGMLFPSCPYKRLWLVLPISDHSLSLAPLAVRVPAVSAGMRRNMQRSGSWEFAIVSSVVVAGNGRRSILDPRSCFCIRN